MQLVNQLWQLEINNAQAASAGQHKQTPVYKVVAKHAAQALRAKLELLAAKKFMEAGGMAFDAKQYKRAISFSLQAEKIMDEVYAKNRNSSTPQEDKTPIPDEFRCRIYLLGGTHRAFFKEHVAANAKQKIVVEKAVKKELGRTKELLFRAIEPQCVIADNAHHSQQLHMALNYLSGIVSGEVNQSRVETVEEYARLLTSSFHLLSAQSGSTLQSAQQQSTAVVDPTAAVADATPFGTVLSIRNNAGSVWNSVGIKYHALRQYEEAAESFEQALRLFAVVPTSSSGDSGQYTVVSAAAMRKHLPSMELTTISCNSLYW